jgi:hypothetical protein
VTSVNCQDAAEIYDILMEQLLAAIRKYDPKYKDKMKQVVETINEKFSERKQFGAVDLGRHLEFDAVKYLRNLVGRGHLEQVGKGVFERALWPPPAALLEGEPIGLTYCVQTWFKYYLQQWITSSMSQLETKEGVYALDARPAAGNPAGESSGRQYGFSARPGRRPARNRGGRMIRSALRRRAKRFKISRGRLRELIQFGQQVLHVVEFHPQRAPVQIHVIGELSPVAWRIHANGDLGASPRPAQLFQRFHEALPAALLEGKLRTGLERLQLPQQGKAIDEEGAAGLIAAEIVHELDGAPAPHAEQPFEQGAVDHRHVDRSQFFPDLCKSK